MKKRLFSLLQHQRGNTAIEFGLISVTLFMMVFGIIEFALIMYASSVIENATVGGSRVGITGNKDGAPTTNAERDANIRQIVKTLSAGLLDEGKIVIDHVVYTDFETIKKSGEVNNPKSSFGCGGQAVLYKVSYNWQLFTPLIGQFFDNGEYRIESATLVKNEDFGADTSECGN